MKFSQAAAQACLVAVVLLITTACVAQQQGNAPIAHPTLAALVPADAGLCVELHDLAGGFERFRSGALFARLRNFPPLRHWLGEHAEDLRAVSNKFQAELGLSPVEIARRIFGREALLAVWPPAAGESQGPIVLLVRAPQADLRAMVERMVESQKRAGQWQESRAIERGGVPARVHVSRPDKNGSQTWLTILEGAEADGIGVVATSESLLHGVIDRCARISAAGDDQNANSLATLPTYQAARARLAPAATLKMFLNPRAWDQALAAQSAPAHAGRALARQALQRLWKASQSVAASVNLDSSADVEFFWQRDRDALPEPMQQVARSLEGEPLVLQRLPDDAVLCVAGHVDLGGLVKAMLLAPPEAPLPHYLQPDRDLLRWAVSMALASGVGPNVGFIAVPAVTSPETRRGWPFEWLVGLETQSIESAADVARDDAPLAERLDPFVRTTIALLAKAQNSRQSASMLTVDRFEIDGRTVTTIAGLELLPPGRKLVYAVDDGYVWAGTAESSLRSLLASGVPQASAAGPRRLAANPRLGQPGQVLFADVARLRKLLEASPEALQAFAAANRLELSRAERPWRQLLDVLRCIDFITVQARNDATGLGLALHIE